jgi:predicted nucleic acid-binding protein
MSKLLIDTNILVYSKDSLSAYHQSSLALIKGANQLYLTAKNITEYYSVVTKGENPLLTPKEALRDLVDFSSVCATLYPSEASRQILFDLILRHNPKGLKIHDFEIAAIALANGINKIATFNKSDFLPIESLEVITPS